MKIFTQIAIVFIIYLFSCGSGEKKMPESKIKESPATRTPDTLSIPYNLEEPSATFIF